MTAMASTPPEEEPGAIFELWRGAFALVPWHLPYKALTPSPTSPLSPGWFKGPCFMALVRQANGLSPPMFLGDREASPCHWGAQNNAF